MVLVLPDKKKEQDHQQAPAEEPLGPPRYEADPSTSCIQHQPCNFISVDRYLSHESIKGTFVVDPAMVIPETMLPPAPKEYNWELGYHEAMPRDNVQLNTSTGSIDATIVVVSRGSEISTNSNRTTVVVTSQRGSITARLQATSERPAIYMNVQSDKGSVAVYLPRSFRGFLTLSSASIILSDLVSAQVAILTHSGTKKQCFIGNVADSLQETHEWSGDELDVTSGRNVKIFYVDESKPTRTGVRSILNSFSRIISGA